MEGRIRMLPKRSAPFAMLWLLFAVCGRAAAQECPVDPGAGGAYAARVAAIACAENRLWHGPFIDAQGRLARFSVAEAEQAKLADGATPVWRRVATYWREAGLAGAMKGQAGAGECLAVPDASMPPPLCRTFLLDHPWSAAFVSWVMVRAGVPGFRPSPSHVDYVRDAWRSDGSAYALADPDAAAPAAGDLLCFVRGSGAPFGYEGLRKFFAAGKGSLAMHCDIAVGTSRDGAYLYLVGGNVLQGVTLRQLPLNHRGAFWSLPRGSTGDCAPGNESGCSFNRQDWVALLKLRPQAELAALPPPVPVVLPVAPGSAPAQAPMQQCCVACVVGSGVPRCPAHAPDPQVEPDPGTAPTGSPAG